MVALTLATLKQAKNAVIGSPTAKRNLAKDQAFLEMLIDCINNPEAYSGPAQGSQDDIRIEAAHVVASLAYSSPTSANARQHSDDAAEALQALLQADALQAFLYAIASFQQEEPTALKAAFARALKALAVAIAETVGPSQWGMRDYPVNIQSEARAALDALFQIETLDIYLPLLLDPSSQTCTAIAQLLASSVRLQHYRIILSEWLPPAERHKEVKTKRGWERPEVVSSPVREGGWVARELVALLTRKDIKLQEAVLLAISAITNENPLVATKLAKAPPDHQPALSTILNLCKSRAIDLQLAACSCATSIIKAGLTAQSDQNHAAAMTVIHVVNSLITNQSESSQVRTKACFILQHLISDDKELCALANERGSLLRICNLIKGNTQTDAVQNWDEDEPESLSCLREAALTALASIALFDNDIRSEITDTQRMIPYIQTALTSRHVGTRYSACNVVRALSRAVSVLRTNIIDTGLGLSVFKLFMSPTEDKRVIYAASAVVSNMVIDFSPLRTTLLEKGVIERLRELLGSGEQGLALKALWTYKNMLFKSTEELKKRVMKSIGWDEITRLLNHENPGLQEQAFHIVRNIADGAEGINMVFEEIGSDALLTALDEALATENGDVLREAVCVLGNLANSATHQPDILARPRILSSLRSCLIDAKVEVRRPAAACVLELVRVNPRSYRALHEVGIDATLRHMLDFGGGYGGGAGLGSVSMSPTRMSGMGFQMGVEDDREVKDKAREALQWMERAIEMGV